MNKEATKLESILKIPVEKLIFQPTYAEVYTTNSSYIGNVLTYNVASIIHYDTSEAIINRLEWHKVYDENKDKIDSLIVKIFPDIPLKVLRHFPETLCQTQQN